MCGKVKFTLSGRFDAFYLCHCSRCRKTTGSAHAANLFGPPGMITWISGQEVIRRFDLPEAERFSKSFCSECGSAVPALGRDGSRLMVPAGSLDDEPGMGPQVRIFWRDRVRWIDDIASCATVETYPGR